MTDPAFLLALAAAALGAASLVLHVVAPRTKNTIDDRLRDDIDEVLAFIRGRAPSSSSKPPIGPAAVLALVLLGLAAAANLSCTAAQRAAVRDAAAAAVVVAIDCELVHATPELLADAEAFGEVMLQRLIAGTGGADSGQVKAAIAPFKTDLMRCGIAGAIAAATHVSSRDNPPSNGGPATSTLPQGLGLMAIDPGPAFARSVFSVSARELGWPPLKTRDGVL